MGKLPTITRLISEDVPAEQRSWFDKMLVSLNSFISTVLSLLNKGLNFQDNFNAMIHTAKFTGRDFSTDPIIIRSTLKGAPIGVVKLKIEDITPDGATTLPTGVPFDIQWTYDNAGKVSITDITNISSDNSASEYRMTFLIV